MSKKKELTNPEKRANPSISAGKQLNSPAAWHKTENVTALHCVIYNFSLTRAEATMSEYFRIFVDGVLGVLGANC